MSPRVRYASLVLLGVLLLGAASTAQPPASSSGQTDQFGGYRSIKVPGGATGFFRVAKLDNRWVLVTPEGHAFWMRAVYGLDITDGGGSYIEALKRKYNDPNHIPWWPYVSQAARRMKSWGFNAIGEYSSNYALPVPAYGRRETNPEKMPFIRMVNSVLYAKQSFGLKDIQYGADPAVTPGLWRVGGFPDVFDPAFERAARLFARNEQEYAQADIIAKSPWLIGTSMDDRDYLFGFGPTRDNGGWHMHLGWIGAVTRPLQTDNPNIWRGATRGVTYTDTKVYSKFAFRDFLREKYQTIAALNAAWTSTYTTWDADGGWPNGRGVLDESGRNRWMGRDFYTLKDTAPQVKADLDEWLGRIADRYFSVTAAAIRSVDKNHLVFSPPGMSVRGHPKVLEAAGRHCDVVQIEGPWDNDALFERGYKLIGKPLFIWTTYMSHEDSPVSNSKREGWDYVNFPTQQARGQAYAGFVRRLITFKGSDGVHPFVGLDFWAWTDKITGGENNNFGLVSNRDNAYDGKEAVVASGKDPWGFATGGEAKNYGDFLSAVTQAHRAIESMLKEPAAAGANRR